MGHYSNLSTRDLVKGIRETDQALVRANDALKILSKRKTMPYKHAAKSAFIESTQKLIELLQKDEKELSAELGRKGLK